MTRYWVGDGLVDADEATVSVLDHGLTVGDGVFEAIAVRRGVPFALTRHLDRLQRSLAGLGLAGPPADQIALAVAAVVADAGHDADGRLRVTVTAGPGPAGSDRGEAAPTLLVTLTPTASWASGATVATVPWVRNERAPTAGIKSTSYADNVIALAYAKARGASEALFANTRGELCEGTGSNVFVVVGGEVITPPLDSGCLAGVTRALVLEWTKDVLPVREVALPIDVLHTADEVFLTSTGRDVQPITQVDTRALAAGPVTAQVAGIFAERSAADSDP